MAEDYDEERLESAHRAEIENWRRRKYSARDAHEHAIKSFRGYLSSALKGNENNRRNLSSQMLDLIQGRRPNPNIGGNGEGYGSRLDDFGTVISPEGIETVTGYGERPWEEDSPEDDGFPR